ncbi:hypothetical protein E4U42_001479 [Claviceps africana]|uniref:Fork-head domain-containing protein n=1 Tax=Claviceps africana TaxID=83212 RepID=A0A8K0NF67_9HYPO|nr:hypothetical protein E4U42_001479 [Claviceps africana]
MAYLSSSSFSSSSPPLSAPTAGEASHDAYSSMISSNASHEPAWPSAPLVSGGLNLNYCLQDSTNGLGVQQPDNTYTPASPNGWFSASSVLCSATTVRYHGKKPSMYQPLSTVCAPTSSGTMVLDNTIGYLSPPNGDKGNASNRLWGVDVITPLNTLEASPMAWSDSIGDSPLSAVTPKDVLVPRLIEARSMPWSMSEAASTSTVAPASAAVPTSMPASTSVTVCPPSGLSAALRESVDSDKTDEPYAKLIYRAFMSRSDHTMTLQEIYQWFRENTTKALTASKGWQNSIRHNLSMNAAFKRKERTPFKTVKSSSCCEDSKRVNEWFLEDWAIRDGVQSTTRYRKSTYARRGPSGRATSAACNPWAPEHSAKRALSGRKGGCATRASRQRMRTYAQAVPDESSQHSLEMRRPSTDVYGYGQVKTGTPIHESASWYVPTVWRSGC